jgi:hypothetical protein
MYGARRFVLALVWLAFSAFAAASQYRGVVTFGGLPLPGASITATQGTKSLTAVSDQAGAFAFDDLADGKWSLEIAMQCFSPIHAEVTITPNMPAASWELKLLPARQIFAGAQPVTPMASASAAPAPAETKAAGAERAQANAPLEPPPDQNDQSADGFLMQGSVNNAATSVYSTSPAFGNTRSGGRALYTGGFTAILDNSAFDARPYSLSGIQATKPAFSDFTGIAAIQGPIRIPRVLPRGPNFFLSYQWTRNSTSTINTGLVPTADERNGNLAGLANAVGQPVTIYDPATGVPYSNNQVPVSTQAAELLKLYPLPNIENIANYNYQAATLGSTHQDELQLRLDKSLGRNYLWGRFGLQDGRAQDVNLFGFVDRTDTLGTGSEIHWSRWTRGISLSASYAFNRMRTEVTPNFANRENVSGNADIGGNNQDPINWGPPALSFSSGFAGLSDSNSAFNRNRTDAFSASAVLYRRKHSITAGWDLRKQEYNYFAQQNPRGVFTFTGAATAQPGSATLTTGSDLADLLIGIPDTSSIAYGNAEKYLREPVYDIYAQDDWRVLPTLSVKAGIRWDYSAPITELFGRLVNLDVASGFTSVAPVVGDDPVGHITGEHYPSSLLRPDRRMVQPRIGIAWRPISASTIVIRAGYGIYSDTSVYQKIVMQMTQQAPLSKSLSVENSTACPLTLANGFASCSATTADTFGIDPNFRIGYAQMWNLDVQRDLPFALQATASYSGIKGTHAAQEILPNSYPLGATSPCPSCPSGFVYETSGGNSIRHAGRFQLRRRLRSGFTASATYTYAKSIDDAAYLGGQGNPGASSGSEQSGPTTPSASVAQNWRNPLAERSLSAFDQRQLLGVQAQYTSGQGLEGNSLLGGWRGRALKEWTLVGTLNFGTGLPETPIYTATVPGTGFSDMIRPDLTGAPIYRSGTNTHLNAAAFSAPTNGQWGTAGRNSITGPNQLSLNSSLARTFRPHGKTSLDVQLISSNILNHASFSSWNSNVLSTQFGQPASANAMRNFEIKMNWRF